MPASFHLALSLTLSAAISCASAAEKVSFNKHIRPIFNNKCTKCHGGAKADGDLSLIYRAEVLGKGKSGKTIIVPGKPEESELFRRITTDDIDDKMPLQEGDHADEPLTEAQVKLIRTWIEQGAQWEDHWAYIKPEKPTTPSLKNTTWAKQPMDQFVLARLEKNNLSPSPEADRSQWLRRASLDLTGLPPTAEELASFTSNKDPNAYEKETSRLLASQSFGERWAAMWMDLARYADTKGFEKDPHRNIWPYRDYLINSFNKDKPYNLFLREQLAGDLMPHTTGEQMIATAFHRNTQTNTEGGTDDEEYRVAAIIDRVNTTWTAAQGLTFGCVQCHAHPYEPIPHEDYYRFMSFLNSADDCDQDNEFPTFKVANNPAQRDQAAKLFQQIYTLRETLNQPGLKAIAQEKDWSPLKYLSHKPQHGKTTIYPNNEVRTRGTIPTHSHIVLTAAPQDFSAIRIDILREEENPAASPERGALLSHMILRKIKVGGKTEDIPTSYLFADFLDGPYDPQASIRGGAAGWGGFPKLAKNRHAVIVPTTPVHFADGEKLQISLYYHASTTGGQATPLRRFKLSLSNKPHWTSLVTNPTHQANFTKIKQALATYNKIPGIFTPVIRQRSTEGTRDTRLFIGGLWLNLGEKQKPGVPKLLNGYQDKVDDRLQMSKWISSPENPLTARVMANRLYSELFGKGIVETLGDFGTTGLAPTNQELLDHLAVAFQTTHKWSIKSLLREMVLSSTYRQDNKATAELAHKDPANHLQARGPRTRLSAEMVRDHALQVSGLITKKLGGPSVMPPQPDGVWQTVYSGAKWVNATGPARYRRAVYTYWKRTSPYPSMVTFDAPSREFCAARRLPTNTPLHALTTLNDPVYLECSRALGKRMTTEGGSSLTDQINHGYQLCTQKKPNANTIKLLADLHKKLLADFTANPTNSKAIAPTPHEAAMTVLANTILNLDAAITK
ncbi:MAG: PSD1 and planctomycete cytochrome C domain-containing protein [Akkermansiaceae bacterium]